MSARIGIVEDQLIVSTVIAKILESYGYVVLKPCTNYTDAIAMLDKEKPDLVLLDVHLDDDKDGITVAEYIRRHNDMPFIFLTSLADPNTVDRIKRVNADAFLLKPVEEKALLVSIELALSNFSSRKHGKPTKATDNYLIKDSIFIKDGAFFMKLRFDDILYLSSEGGNVTFVTERKKYVVRGSITQFLEKMQSSRFFKVHRGYAVNLDKVDTIDTSFIYIRGQAVPVAKGSRTKLLSHINTG